MRLTKYILGLGISMILFGCSETPNSISMTVTSGNCVQASFYNSAVQESALANYPQIKNNPTTAAPYCASVTVVNNNSGQNANTVQINNGGLGITYSVGSQQFAAEMYDPIAAGLTISGSQQQVGNLAVFDPKNCLTTQGASVQYLNTGGGSCTFYLQLLNESNPVGVYPTTLMYNYTNGNLNYSISNIINQRVYLYAGTSNGLNFLSTNVIAASQGAPTNQAAWSTGITGAPNTSVSYVTQAPQYGYVYFSTGSSVYMFNGTSASQIGGNLPAPVISIAFDTSLNPYAATANGVYVYSNNTWTQMVDTFNNANTNLIGLNGIESLSNPNVLYAYNESQMYTCNNLNLTNFTMSCAPQINQAANPSIFFPNSTAIDATSGALYAGAYFAYSNQYSIGFLPTQQWTIPPFTVTPPIYSNIGAYNYISGVIWVPAITNGSSNNIYFGLYNESAISAQNESAVYSCQTTNFLCSPLLSGNVNNIVGNVKTVAADGMGNVYVAGLQLNSTDFESSALTNTLGGFLISNPTTITQGGVSVWTPIANGSVTTGPVNTSVVSSMITSY